MLSMSLNIDAQHLAEQQIRSGGSSKMLILGGSWHVFFLYFYVISNFGVPYMTRHFDNIALLHMISILLDS
jgi:hypothetical protein